MKKAAYFSVLLVSLCSIVSCTKAKEKQKEVDRETFIEEVAKIEKHEYQKAKITYRDERHSFEYDQTGLKTDTIISSNEFHDISASIVYKDSPLEGYFYYEFVIDEADDHKLDGYSGYSSLSEFLNVNVGYGVNLQNLEFIFEFYDLFDYIVYNYYTNPLALRMSGKEEYVGYLKCEYDDFGYPTSFAERIVGYTTDDDDNEICTYEEYAWVTIEYE